MIRDELNFLLTNRVPRRLLTHFMGWYSSIESPLLTHISIAVWRLFSDLDLSESRYSRFTSLQACFIRELKPGLRPVDSRADSFVSPCDAVVGACGRVKDGQVYQIKGFPYALSDLVGSNAMAERYRNGSFVTLRLTASMYHRFHAPVACRVRRVRYLSGDVWNVNPPALARIEKLYCRNERAALEAVTGHGDFFVLVAVAAILVASIRLPFIDTRMHLRYTGPEWIDCDHAFNKGQEVGWFEHGSTIVVLLPETFTLLESVTGGRRIRMGEALATRNVSGAG